MVSRRLGNLTFVRRLLLLVAGTVNLEVEVLAVAARLLVVLTFDKESEKRIQGAAGSAAAVQACNRFGSVLTSERMDLGKFPKEAGHEMITGHAMITLPHGVGGRLFLRHHPSLAHLLPGRRPGCSPLELVLRGARTCGASPYSGAGSPVLAPRTDPIPVLTSHLPPVLRTEPGPPRPRRGIARFAAELMAPTPGASYPTYHPRDSWEHAFI